MGLKYTSKHKNNQAECGFKIYEYEYDHRKYYDNYKEKKGRSICPCCGSDVSNIYLAKHQATSKKCLKAAEGMELRREKDELIERMQKMIEQLGMGDTSGLEELEKNV